METLVDEEGNALMDQNGTPPLKMPNLRVELHTYRVVWYDMHYPSLMTVVQESEGFMPFMQRLECSSWIHSCMFFIRRTIQSGTEIHDVSYGDRLLDFAGPDGFTTLSTDVFCWLINIQPGYLVFHQGNVCTIEP